MSESVCTDLTVEQAFYACLHNTGLCGVRKVNIIFKVCLTLLCALSLSLIFGLLPVYLARQLAV